MTKKELVIVYIIKSIIESRMTIKNAAKVLGLNEYQIKHLKASVKKDGKVFIIHKNRGRKPKHTIPGKIRDKIVSLALTKYKGANYTHLSELLREFKGIAISQSSVSRILKDKNIKSPRKHKSPKPHRTRERKSQEGLLLQMDAFPYE
jgi:transposase